MTPRRATNYTPQAPITHIQSLQQCVHRLQDSSSLLKASVKKLEGSTRNFSRLRKLIACQRVFELVTEPEIREAQRSVAVQLEPRVRHLLHKAEELLAEIEQRENVLQEETNMRELELDKELKKSQASIQKPGSKTDHSGTSAKQSASRQRKAPHNGECAKKLKEVKKKMERMAKSVKELEDDYKHKASFDFCIIYGTFTLPQIKTELNSYTKKNQNKGIKCLHPVIVHQLVIKVNSSGILKPRDNDVLENIEEQIKELDTIIGEKREILDERQNAIMEVSRDNEIETDEDFKWKQIQAQYEFFKRAEQQIESGLNWPNDAATEFEILCNSYLRSLENIKLETQKSIASRQEQRNKTIENMKKLCKLLYPSDNIGVTIARLVEILLQSKQKEIFVKELRVEFPPEQKRLHHLQTAIATLNQFEITETVLEEANGLDKEEQMILKLKVDVDY
ncbi:18637_t:CDS:2 [Acaulospora morrowiae]|uniref:DASH complex subunit SPC19 n=1 Tax=Acaulospora morrowiae TaxID=94023 RepID=A0A9N9BEP9_9GLOM|nr:18637_t:CDS:2 [Acaulospora morrowiae]